MAYRIANIGKTGILKVKKSNAEQLKYRPDLGDVDLDISSELNTNTSGSFNTITGGILDSCVVNIEPKQSGSGTPSPQNVRPITGHSSVEVGNVGKNRLKNTRTGTSEQHGLKITSYADGSVFYHGGYTASAIDAYDLSTTQVISNGSYILNGCPSGGGGTTFQLSVNDINDTGLSNSFTDTGSGVNVTISNGGVYRPRVIIRQGYTIPSGGLLFKPMLRLATETDASFVPYNGSQYTVALGQTVYGGSVDVVSGVLTVDKVCTTFDGSNDETIEVVVGTAFNRISCAISSDSITNSSTTEKTNKIWSDKYVEITDSMSNSGITGIYYRANGSHKAMISTGEVGVTDVASARTWLSNNPVQICYVLATPIIIQLTPQQIETLIGQNNVSVPLEGQSLDELTYREVLAWDDVETAIEPKADISAIGTDESGRTTASRQYVAGEHFYKDGKFGTTKTTVAQGATWTLNTNYVEGDISDYIEPKTGTLTVNTASSSYVTLNSSSVIRVGNIVYVKASFTVANMPTVSGTLALFDLPYKNDEGVAITGILASTTIPFKLKDYVPFIGTGEGSNKRITLTEKLSNDTYLLSISYITKDSI